MQDPNEGKSARSYEDRQLVLRGVCLFSIVSTFPSYRGHIMIGKAVAAGARDFVPKDILVEFLPTAIEIIHRGEPFFLE